MKKVFLIRNKLILPFLTAFCVATLLPKAQAFPNLFGQNIPDQPKKVLDWCKANLATIQSSMARQDVFYEKQGRPRSVYSKPFSKGDIFQFYPYEEIITRSPRFSKDYKTLYFLVTDSTYSKTHLIAIPASGEPQYIFTYDGNFRYYDISPDGNNIIFSTLPGKERPSILIYSIPNRNLTTVMDQSVGGAFPNYSPDGQSFVYSGRNEKTIVIRNLKTGTDQVLVNDFMIKELPKYSPNGAYIVYQGWSGEKNDHFDVFRVKVYGGEVKKITNSQGLSANPSFDRTSQWIIFIATPIGEAGNRICMTDIDGINTAIDPTSLPHCWFPVF